MTAFHSTASVSKKIINLQWLRFIAAAAVLLYHASVYLTLMMNEPYGADRIPSWMGSVGVAVFFALSGNLMATAMQRARAPQFLLHRVGRIYPAFFLVTALAYVAGFLSPIKPLIDLQALTLFPYGKTSYPLGVEWTLVFEIAFYMFVFLLILFKKTAHASAFLIGWLALILLHNVLAPDNPAVNVFPPLTLPFVSLNVSFAAGMLLPLVLQKHRPHPILAGVLAVSLFHVGLTMGVMGVRWGMGFGAALVVCSLARVGAPTQWSGRVWVDFLGDKLGSYSYALYLCHVPVIRTVYATAPDENPALLFYTAIFIAFALSVVLGEADVRMYQAIKRRTDSASLHTVSRLAGFYSLAFFAFAVWAIRQ